MEVFWEEGYNEWYPGELESVDPKSGTASIYYAESDELEKGADLLQLVKHGWLR